LTPEPTPAPTEASEVNEVTEVMPVDAPPVAHSSSN
jgi:hypothetical protein